MLDNLNSRAQFYIKRFWMCLIMQTDKLNLSILKNN